MARFLQRASFINGDLSMANFGTKPSGAYSALEATLLSMIPLEMA